MVYDICCMLYVMWYMLYVICYQLGSMIIGEIFAIYIDFFIQKTILSDQTNNLYNTKKWCVTPFFSVICNTKKWCVTPLFSVIL